MIPRSCAAIVVENQTGFVLVKGLLFGNVQFFSSNPFIVSKKFPPATKNAEIGTVLKTFFTFSTKVVFGNDSKIALVLHQLKNPFQSISIYHYTKPLLKKKPQF